ncbi:hypothetical protein [Aureimonas psammosilenae]|uniref:hypothetical protein n=1 Tax=Aureimonas psammosilenae TaxID=2495496 RepID=UPI001260A363|nr:hypothetical protein [Aureimonas psammosilenae]
MILVLRLVFLIPLGFVAACLGAAFALIGPFVGPFPPLDQDPLYWFELAWAFGIQAVQIGSVAFLPWACFMIATEFLGLGSILIHAAAGLLGAFAYLRLSYDGAMPDGGVRTAVIAAGLVFALVYWLVAGRGAGRERSRQREGVRRIETAKPENTDAKT